MHQAISTATANQARVNRRVNVAALDEL